MELKIMYPPQKDSPTTFLLGAITSTDIFAIVTNAGLLPRTLPFPLTLGPDKPITETVLVTEVDLETNRIVFERSPGALPWVAGTTVGRVFTAGDLKAVQDNIVGMNAEVVDTSGKIAGIEESVENLEVVVGDEDSGLVKGLADEVVRAKAAEAAEVLRAMTAEGELENKKIDRTDLPQVITDASYAADATKLNTTLTRYNASSKQTSTYERTIPIITDTTVGLMTPEAYNEIAALRNDIGALQQQGGRFIGISFDTKSALDSYDVPDSVKAGDFTYVLDDEDHQDSTTRYIYNGATFEFGFVVNYDPVGLATSEIAGLVKSTDGTPLGKVFVETDGTMSVVGWDALNTNVNSKVPNSRKVNDKTLTGDIVLNASDVGAVPIGRKVNDKTLTGDIVLNASDVGAVPIGRKVNDKTLTGDIVLNASDVGAVPIGRKVNSKELSSDITLTAIDVNANTTSVNATLSTTWSGTGPYTQDVAISGMTSTKNATVGLASTATETQRAAARNAIFNVTDQTANQITIAADGEKPTITIPISVILMP